MPEFRAEPLIVPVSSGLLPEGERNRRVALTSFSSREKRASIPTRQVTCYECGRQSHVPAAALSANCIHCHAHLRMTDVEMKAGSRKLTVRTLGNVTVRDDAVLSHVSVVCNNLHMYGRASGTFRCSGVAHIFSEVEISGGVSADKLAILKGANVTFAQAAVAREIKVQGRCVGNLKATERIRLKKGAAVEGDCTTPNLIVEPGAQHLGRWVRISPAQG